MGKTGWLFVVWAIFVCGVATPCYGGVDYRNGEEAIRSASAAGKDLYLFLYDRRNSETRQREDTFDGAMTRIGSRAVSAKVSIADPSERGLVKKFGLRGAPMPLVLVVAPNGVVIRGFANGFSSKDLELVFSTPAMAASLKALQDEKMVFLCIGNSDTGGYSEAVGAVREFKVDLRFRKGTEIVMIDPSDERELPFLRQLNVGANNSETTTIIIAPPLDTVGRFEGAVDKETLVTTIKDAASGCGADCSCH